MMGLKVILSIFPDRIALLVGNIKYATFIRKETRLIGLTEGVIDGR